MIDGQTNEPVAGSSGSGRVQPAAPSSGDALYSDLFGARIPSVKRPENSPFALAAQASAASGSRRDAAAGRAPAAGLAISVPRSPVSVADTGLSLMSIVELVLKHLYIQGNILGAQIARQCRLSFQVIDEALKFLKDEKCVEVVSGETIGPASYRFNLTELGRHRAREAFEQCRYVGPAPIPLTAYIEQCRKQTVAGTECTPSSLLEAFADLIVRPGLLEELGPAVCSGRSIFVYGPPGNGKTMIAKGLGRFLNDRGGDIFVPYAIEAEGSIITMFDPTIHRPTDQMDVNLGGSVQDVIGGITRGLANQQEEPVPDLRWRRVRRPVVMTGGELTLDMLDLRYNRDSNFYTAPLHIKANGGVFLIDDFGRQIVSPRDLLNRWILPLEERIDYLTLATGKKFAIPFEQLIVFSTNLDPRELVDEAFLRRIRHKIRIGPPSRDLFSEIFQLNCAQRNIPFSAAAVDFLFANFYDLGKPPRSSDPRDLLEIAQSICRFRQQPIALTTELMAEATERFFCQI